MITLKIFGLWSVLLLMLASFTNAVKVQHMRQIKTLPISPSKFAKANPLGENTTLEEVQRKGDLIKWIQVVDGIPVYGSVVTTRSDKRGRIIRKEGLIAESPTILNPKPNIPKEEAIDLLKIEWNHFGLDGVYWRLDEPKLYVLPSGEKFDKLVWLTSYYVNWKNDVIPKKGFGPVPSTSVGLVNAHNGKVEETWSGLQQATVKAIVGNDKTGKAFRELDVEKKGNLCWHRDDERRIEVYTVNNGWLTLPNSPSYFVCDRAACKSWDLHQFNGGFSPRNEAFLHATYFVDLWRELVGNEIQPYYANDSYLDIYVHYGSKTKNANAQFNGGNFIFGDGDNQKFPMTSLDIVCHEIGHAITLWRGGKLKPSGEPGAINEAYSDILGETCDMHYKNKTDYLIGEEIMRPGEAKALRNMCNPPEFGAIDDYDQYNDKIRVHDASGIYNKAWCTLSKKPGWDYIKAFQVFNDANLMFWCESVTMHCGAYFVESAAYDLGLSKEDVTAAFKVVGVESSKCKESLLFTNK